MKATTQVMDQGVKKRMTTQQITINAMLAAVCAVLGYLEINTMNLKLSFESFPVLLAGLMFGPLNGALVGGIGTLLGQMLKFGLEASTPLWVIPYIIEGWAVGMFAKSRNYNNSVKEVRIIAVLSELLVFVLNRISLFFYSKLLFGAFSIAFVTGTALPRLAIAIAKGVFYAAITHSILKKLSRVTHNGGRI